ncbi:MULTISPECIES: hypothetical protein [Anoxybacillus]|nr:MULTISPECIES: hypothetical protein [Anoxybacillus]
MEARKALARQIGEVVVPEVDIYRFAVICTNAGTTATASITKNNSCEAL